MRRLGNAANADVVFRVAERNEAVPDCDTGCSRQAVRTVTVATPDSKVVASVNLCEEHGQAASNDRTNAKLGLEVKHEFIDKRLRGDPEVVRRLEPEVTNPNLQWKTVRLEDRVREPIARDTLERGYGREL
jgi:hypothetical protein